ncbi:MAG: ferritin-like domain-containing protein [Acidimicrobiia bacterium]
MSTRYYTLPLEETQWRVPSGGQIVFNWEYEEGRDRLLRLYEKGKNKQWNATDRIDWSVDVDVNHPAVRVDETMPIYGTDVWNRMSEEERAELRVHSTAWTNSQFLHGEQGALICAAKIVGTVPDVDSKFYAATQVIDEARHVEVFSRYLREKLGVAYPINPDLRELLDQVIQDARWDMTYLGMQVMIEGLALAAFGLIRDSTKEPLARVITTYVMQDEARHVAFGRLALQNYYAQITERERQEREEFVIDASYLMRNRFRGQEVWQRLGLPQKEMEEITANSPLLQEFRKLLFSRIVPTVKALGLWGPRVQRAYEEMGVIQFQDLDPDVLSAADEQAARRLDEGGKLSEEGEAAARLAGVDEKRALEIEQTIAEGEGE